MYSLTIEEAIKTVRKNLDEIGQNDSQMINLNDNDSENLDATIKKTIAESINTVHRIADISLLDGESIDMDNPDGRELAIDDFSIKDSVLSFSVSKEILRLVAFKASDSPFVLSEAVPEYSAEGRMQLNPYTRGTSDNPRLIILQGRNDDKMIFRYYSLSLNYSEPKDAVDRFEYIPYQKYDESATLYKVAYRLVDQVLDCLTGMVLAIYQQTERSNYFLAKAGIEQTNNAQ